MAAKPQSVELTTPLSIERWGLGRVALKAPLLTLFLIALAFRLILVVMSGQFQGFVLDDGTYHMMATSMADGDLSNWDDFTYSLYWRTAAFLAPVTALYKIFGPVIAAGQVYVAFVGALVVVVATRLALEILPRPWALATGATLALLPSQAFWSSQLMKDASVWLALVIIAAAVAIAGRSKGLPLLLSGVGVAGGLVALAFLREHTLVVASWAVMTASIAGIASERVKRVAGALFLCITIPWGIAAIGPAGLDLVMNAGSMEVVRFQMAQGANTAIVDTTPGGTESELNNVIIKQQELSREAEAVQRQIDQIAASGGEGSDEPDEGEGVIEKPVPELKEDLARIQDEMDTLLAKQTQLQGPPPGAQLEEGESLDPSLSHLPRGLSVMLLEPFPLPFEGSASLRLARLESLVWYPLLLLAAVGLWRARSNLRTLAFPLLAGAGIVVMYALSEGNVGTAHRHRGEIVWVVVLLAGVGAHHWWEQRRAKPSDGT